MRSILRNLFRAGLRNYPFYSGAGTIANLRPFEWATEDLLSPVSVRLRNGLILRVNPQEYLGRSVFYTRDWDPKISWAVERILRRGDTFLDIGAHCGITSLIGAGAVGKTGRVHAFEPQPQMVSLLKETVRLNGLSNLQIHDFALSSTNGVAELHIQFDKPILASLERSDDSGQTISVKRRKSGEYLRTLDLGPIRLIKIDVEGHELEILQGSAGYFENENMPSAFLFESIDAEGSFWSRPVVKWLHSLGYVFFALPKRMMSMHAVRVGSDTTSGWHDYVAVAPTDEAEIGGRLR